MATIDRGPLPKDNYTIVSNDWIRDDELSWDARAILIWLSSHSRHFEISIDSIVAACKKDGRHIVREALAELEDHGYLTRAKQRNEAGRIIAATYTLTDPGPAKPQVTTNVQSSDDGQDSAKPQVTPNVQSSNVGLADVGSADGGSANSGQIALHKKTNSSKKTKEGGAELSLVDGTPDPVAPTTRRRATPLPADWAVSEHLLEWARDKGAPSPKWVTDQTERFTLWAEARGRTYVNWDRGWQNWIAGKLEDMADHPSRSGGRPQAPSFYGQGMFT